MSWMIEAIGFLAAFCTTVAFVPQVYHIVKTKDTSAISLPMYLIFTLGIISWLIYGIAIGELPLILANGITLVLSLWIVVLKIKHK